MSAITVRKYDWRGRFRYAWEGKVATRTADHLIIEATWRGPGEPEVGEIRFVNGDRFVEHYYPGRGYAIWQIEQPDGSLKGWYCNVSTPVEEHDDTLSFRDLLLDLLVYPDGRMVELDRDEFEAAQGEGLDPGEAAAAEAALAELREMAHSGASPFRFAADRSVGRS
jgi:predicted RNA-binding protein associated with RNAse of E/G family